ncbi:NAD(P)-dependent oxidoreductase [Leptospira gomenensis]|uniref:NAD(P)-dependent oxidoreductase n=1 Tax=Leptospira gomenensis TaxID=2484974 RepID=A0A5F1Y865_9LEPT|nr:NAD(P)-dependent oxidoreductase [Leptospira gomenensis]TGK45425.1 NAD(P)-dependent oxidoreductase [Leptospira gomenensis]TGK66294.1 NAD(P)-dependent oxidoreductase [Leptospira gomenensis]
METSLNRKRIVVFGGSGFLGSHIADKLSDYGHEITIFDLHGSRYIRPDQTMVIGDILDETQVEEVIEGKDVVYNFAGYADIDTASLNPKRTANLNIVGNLNILDACVKHSVKQFVYASTMYVYSDSGGFYRCSKQSSEIFIEEYHKRFHLNYTILRYGTLYGPRADERNSIYRYLKSALETGRIVCNFSGQEIREYIHVRDAAKVSAKILSSEFLNKRFTITGHQAIPVATMLSMIQEILQGGVEIVFDNNSNSDHYKVTPYSYVPKIGEKFAPEIFTDMGQGLIECLAEVSDIMGNSK